MSDAPLTLAIETSSRAYALCLGRGAEPLYDSTIAFPGYRERDLTPLLRTGLGKLGAEAASIGKIAVNIGPGGLGSVRAGVAFANALGYALRAPVAPLLSFELLAAEVWRKTDRPVLCLRKAADGQAYGGLLRRGAPARLAFGPLARLVAALTYDVGPVALAGTNREQAAELIAQSQDSGVEAPTAATVLTLAAGREGRSVAAEPVLPINEFAPEFPHLGRESAA